MQKYHDEPRQYKGYLKSALVIRYQDGWVDIEHFPDLVTSIEYAIELRRTLMEGGWQPSFVLDGPLAAAS